MRIIAIINQKGGCGKTTSAVNLAGITARKGYRTLLVDMDPQSHCAAGLAIPEQRIDLDIGDAMLAPPDQPVDPKRLLWRASRNLDLAPSRMRLAGLEASRGGLAERPDKDRRLSAVLSKLARNYDICFIDCSPSIGLLTYNALAAATEVLIPVETSFFSLQGATKQVNTIRTLAKRLESNAPYWLFATIHEEGSVLARDLLEEMRRRFAKRVAPDVIRRDPTLKEAASFGQPIIEYAPNSTGAKDYSALAEWLLTSMNLETDGRARDAEPAAPVPEEVFPEITSVRPTQEVLGGLEAKLGLSRASSPAEMIRGEADIPPPPLPPHAAEPMVATAPTSTRAEEMAQRARVLLLKRADEQLRRVTGEAAAVSPPAVQPATIAETRAPIVREASARARADSVRELLGVRQTRTGMLFVQPASLGLSVQIAGDFNAWTPIPMRRNDQMSVFELCMPLPAGRWQYRLVADGRWMPDSFNDRTEPNPFGELNSVIEVASA